MAGELVETGRLWARQNAAIKPEWAERIGAHLVKRSYSEPHWSRKRASVMAHERVTLYGVPLVTDRLVAFGKIDRELSRELFIRHALVYGEWSSRHRFLGENQRLLEEAEELEHRARRRDIVVDEHTLFDFYDARIGADVVSGAHFDQWWKQERRTRPDLLTFDPAMLTHDTAEEVRAEDFPEAWQGEGLTFPISYHFEPGAADDGLTIDVPVATLNRVAADDFSWNVPGRPARAGHQPDPQPAEEPPGQLRAGPRQGAGVPGQRSRPARSRCSTRSSAGRGRRPAWSSRARPGTGPRWRPTSSRPTASSARPVTSRPAARTSRRSRRRCAASSTRRSPRSPTTAGWVRPARPRGPSARSPTRSCRPGPATRCCAHPGASPTRARPSGSGSSARPTRPRRGTGSAYDGCCCWSCPRATRPPDLDTTAAARPGRLAVPQRRRAPRRPPRRDPRRRGGRPAAGPHARGVRRAGRGRPRGAGEPAPVRC